MSKSTTQYSFADDISEMATGHSTEVVINSLEDEANLLIKYMKTNKLIMNPQKTQLILSHMNGTIEIENVTIESQVNAKLLGMWISPDMKWKTHIEKLLLTLNKRLGIIKRLKEHIPKTYLKI